jgi:L-aminopeptidase/D-esterase-like protein
VGFPVAGVRAGHWTGDGTGVTVLLLPAGTVGSGEVRGGAPATRETALLDPAKTVASIDAIVFAGGSAFGLAAADGVMRFLAERARGYATAGGAVPIVPAGCVYDLVEARGEPPSADDGYAAAVAAELDQPFITGRVGAGAGATVGKWRGREHAAPGGVGLATTDVEGARIAAVAIVNAIGDVVDADGRVLAGSSAPAGAVPFPTPAPFEEPAEASDRRGEGHRDNTTLVAVVTDAVCSKLECHLLAQSAHDGLARALHPSHTRFDGDWSVALATGIVEVHFDRLRIAAADVVADAIRTACR